MFKIGIKFGKPLFRFHFVWQKPAAFGILTEPPANKASKGGEECCICKLVFKLFNKLMKKLTPVFFVFEEVQKPPLLIFYQRGTLYCVQLIRLTLLTNEMEEVLKSEPECQGNGWVDKINSGQQTVTLKTFSKLPTQYEERLRVPNADINRTQRKLFVTTLELRWGRRKW